MSDDEWNEVLRRARKYLAAARDASDDGEQHVVDLIDAYLTWRERCIDAHTAYKLWRDGRHADRFEAFVLYQLALDEEEFAADEYQHVLESIRVAMR